MVRKICFVGGWTEAIKHAYLIEIIKLKKTSVAQAQWSLQFKLVSEKQSVVL